MTDRSIGLDATRAHGHGESDSGTTLRTGDVLGGYRVVCLLGRGGMGEVYEAENTVSHKRYALKTLPRAAAVGRNFVERFRLEARVMSDLEHPHIVRVHHAGEADGVYYLTMDLVNGPAKEPRTLEDEMGAGRLDPARVREWAVEICSALSYAHEHDVVHRDLKPSNVLLDPTGHAKVADFGLAKVVGTEYLQSVIQRSVSLSMAEDLSLGDEATQASPQKPSSSARSLLGTYDYMSPEQKAGGEIGPRSDLYALGVMLYRMLTGGKPEGRWKPPSAFGCHRSWDDVVGCCLENNPADRPASAALLGRRIARLSSGRPYVARRLVVVLAVVVLAGGGLGLSRLARRAGSTPAVEEGQRPMPDDPPPVSLDTLRREAEAALSAGDWASVGLRLDEIERHGASVEDLRRREMAAIQSELRKRYADAWVEFQTATNIDRGQGLDRRVTDLQKKWLAAGEAKAASEWREALVGYEDVLVDCRAIVQADGLRKGAGVQRQAAVQAMQEAEAAGAATDGGVAWTDGLWGSGVASNAWESGDFAEASNRWAMAVSDFRNSIASVQAMSTVHQADSNLRQALQGVDLALLKTHGGAEWARILLLVERGEAVSIPPDDRREAYETAIAALPGALEAAEQRRDAAMERAAKEEAASVARKAAEAEQRPRLAEERRFAEAAQRARALLARVGSMATAIDSSSAKSLDDEFDKVRNELSGLNAALLARASASSLLELRSAVEDGRRAIRPGPPPGRDWVSPTTRMEFVWVPALGIWVGKYEVTNGEYRKMVPDHDSKEQGGKSLNGDRQPVAFVSFEDARTFADWMTRCDDEAGALPGNYRYRLPSEHEWQSFARCGSDREYPWGDKMPPGYGNFADVSAMRVFPKWTIIDGHDDGAAVACAVEESGKNDWGLYGVGGNVWEAAAGNNSGQTFGAWRGASWAYSSPVLMRCVSRSNLGGSIRDADFGFRLVLESSR